MTFRRKMILSLNIQLIAAVMVGAILYDRDGGTTLKGITSAGFALVGVLNLMAYPRQAKPDVYALRMVLGLFLCAAADVALNKEFTTGVALFILGHVCYLWAGIRRQGVKWQDLLPSGALFAGATALLIFYPFDFPQGLQGLFLIYALAISLMTGKAVSNFLREKGLHSLLVMAGALLFFLSDVFLVLIHFSDTFTPDTACLLTYYPAQCILAHSLYHRLRRLPGA